MATTDELISTIQTQIQTVMANPENYVDYTVGNKTFKRGQYLTWLKDMLKELREQSASEADMEFIQFDAAITLDGQDNTQTVILP